MFQVLLAAEGATPAGGLAPLWKDTGLPLAIMGMLVVFAALSLIRLFITYLPWVIEIIDRLHAEPAAAAASPPAVAPVPAPASEGTPPEVIAAITAAVAAVVQQPHRIIQTREVTSPQTSWALEGRMQHHASHRLNPRDPR